MPQRIDLTGHKFGRLTVIKFAGKAKDRHSLWLCLCECGNKKVIHGRSIKSGLTQSCGCLNYDKLMERNIKHNGCGTRVYTIWKNMKERCLNDNHPRFNDYGGRGIKISNEWINSFATFREWSLKNGYSVSLTLDRKNNNGDYEPANCRWATYKEQNNNRRNSVTQSGCMDRR